ncbi:MAG: SLC13 family permease [Vicinamibacteria bacterium]
MSAMGPDAWITSAVLIGIVAILAATNIAADMVMLGGLTLLMTLGILSPREALSGLAEPAMVTVAALFIVAAGIRETGALNLVIERVFGRPRSVFHAQTRMMLPVAGLSAFMNNTPLVAMLLPVVSDWSKKMSISPSKLLMPLSFATILGGLTSKIGTSTNVIVSGLMLAQLGRPMEMFELARVGLPAALAGIAYMLIFSRYLLPERKPALNRLEDPRAYTVEMLVEPASALEGKSIEEAGLRHLSGMYLMEIDRDEQILTAVGPEMKLQGGDRLIFVGVVESVVELQRLRGLKPATNQVFKLDGPPGERCLVEAVVSDTCPAVGKSIRESRFRSIYGAAVIAVARSGERIRKKIGDIVLTPGDTLLLSTHPSFVENQRNSRDFFLVSSVEGSTPIRHERGFVALGILGAMVLGFTFQVRSEVTVALVAAALMILSRCCSAAAARRSLDWQVLLVIAASLGLGAAMQKTGAARAIAASVVSTAGEDPTVALTALYGITMLFTEMLSNNTAAVLMFPIALATAESLSLSPMPFVMAITIAASCGFATPIGYQTNLMVYGPGGYRFSDYLRFGGVLNLIVWVVTIVLVPRIWSF